MTNVQPEQLAVPPDVGAQMVGLGRTKFYELLAAGTIQSIKVGRRRIVPVAALRAFTNGGAA